MPDPLNPIVQKMIDAGESEENIATVIQHYKQTATGATPAPGGEWVDGPTGKTWHSAVTPDANRADAAMFGFDQAKIANWASKLPEPYREKAAMLASGLATIAEQVAQPEDLLAVGGRKAIAGLDAAGSAVSSAAKATGRVLTSPMARNAAARAVKMGATAVGAAAGHAPGAVVGSTVGEMIADAIRPSPATVEHVSLPGFPREGTTPAPPPVAMPASPPTGPVQAGALTQEQIGQRLAAGAPPTPPPPAKPPAGANLAAQRAEFDARVAARQAPAAPPPAAEPIAAPAAASPAVEAPAGNGLPDQKAINEAALARRRAEYQASQAPAKPSLTAAESGAYLKLRTLGKSDAEAKALILASRAFNEAHGLPTPTGNDLRFPKGMRGNPEGAQK